MEKYTFLYNTQQLYHIISGSYEKHHLYYQQ